MSLISSLKERLLSPLNSHFHITLNYPMFPFGRFRGCGRPCRHPRLSGILHDWTKNFWSSDCRAWSKKQRTRNAPRMTRPGNWKTLRWGPWGVVLWERSTRRGFRVLAQVGLLWGKNLGYSKPLSILEIETGTPQLMGFVGLQDFKQFWTKCQCLECLKIYKCHIRIWISGFFYM